jgi:hypothetical protein
VAQLIKPTVADYLGPMAADPEDRAWASGLLAQPVSRAASEALRALLAGAELPDVPDEDGAVAVLLLAPHIAELLAGRGVAPEVIAATVADIGRHLRRHRRATGEPGLLNWRWFHLHASGRLIEVERLQFEVLECAGDLRELVGPWALNIHIPALSGPLTPEVVDSSLASGVEEVRRAWPGIRLRSAVCESWLLDPFLAERLPQSNIARFAERFTPHGSPVDEPTDPLYFLWGHRDLGRLPASPSTSLERVVVERIRAGGTWQTGRGALRLPS